MLGSLFLKHVVLKIKLCDAVLYNHILRDLYCAVLISLIATTSKWKKANRNTVARSQLSRSKNISEEAGHKFPDF